ncbi:prepilin peptidase [Niveibacterium microcysteis]|uniref:Prepilin leader peptidase/N-methyltransferase n=1 Tax=Niveibacterium microcysteis TaxID=2811415 RepID=A0ABX7M8V3_9RHOO|nr:A24 family peptidase [Niveibacterium microcysteis]QSI78170.1 prepilin peptidase [Niveibacterium microcysteis]
MNDLAAPPELFAIVSCVIGLCIGSFLNVVIHRLPKIMEREWYAQAAELSGVPVANAPALSISQPRSRCPHCGTQIASWQNVPLLSYLILRGRCAHCRASIGIRYPFVELLGGVSAAVAAWHFGFTWAALGAMAFGWAMIALTFIDLDTQLLPDSITLPLLWLGLLLNVGGTYVPLDVAVIGAAAGYLALWSVYWLFKLATGKEGMGYGDFKLLAAIGAFVGWQQLPLVILASSAIGAVVGIALIVFARHGRSTPIPFGPYLAGAGVVALYWGPSLTSSYLAQM